MPPPRSTPACSGSRKRSSEQVVNPSPGGTDITKREDRTDGPGPLLQISKKGKLTHETDLVSGDMDGRSQSVPSDSRATNLLVVSMTLSSLHRFTARSTGSHIAAALGVRVRQLGRQRVHAMELSPVCSVFHGAQLQDTRNTTLYHPGHAMPGQWIRLWHLCVHGVLVLCCIGHNESAGYNRHCSYYQGLASVLGCSGVWQAHVSGTYLMADVLSMPSQPDLSIPILNAGMP